VSQQFYGRLLSFAPLEFLAARFDGAQAEDGNTVVPALDWTQTRQCGQDSWHEFFIVNVERNDLTQIPPNAHLDSKGNADVEVFVLLKPLDEFFFTNGGITVPRPTKELASLLAQRYWNRGEACFQVFPCGGTEGSSGHFCGLTYPVVTPHPITQCAWPRRYFNIYPFLYPAFFLEALAFGAGKPHPHWHKIIVAPKDSFSSA
jgi:hypothetical protein